jgi:hypothetical protein
MWASVEELDCGREECCWGFAFDSIVFDDILKDEEMKRIWLYRLTGLIWLCCREFRWSWCLVGNKFGPISDETLNSPPTPITLLHLLIPC